MGEICRRARGQAAKGIVPPKFNFAPVRADAKRVITGAPFAAGPGQHPARRLQEEGRQRSTRPADVKARLIADATAALAGPFRRGDRHHARRRSTRSSRRRRAMTAPGACRNGAAYYAARLRASTTTDLTADQIHQHRARRGARASTARWRRSRRASASTGTLQQFFAAHQERRRSSNIPNTEEGRQHYLTDAQRLHRPGDGRRRRTISAACPRRRSRCARSRPGARRRPRSPSTTSPRRTDRGPASITSTSPT